MKRQWLAGGLLLLACHPKSKALPDEASPALPVSASASASASTGPALMTADAAPPAESEKPLAWGTRPNLKGPLFPVIDGVCQYAEVFPVGDRALVTFGHGNTSIAKLEDDGLVLDPKLEKAIDSKAQGALTWSSPYEVRGTWPALVLYSSKSTRLRANESLWKLGEEGWTSLERYDDTDEPYVTTPVIFKGWLISGRASWTENGTKLVQIIRSWPIERDAPAVKGLASLMRAGFIANRIDATSDSIYAFGEDRGGGSLTGDLVRVLTDGKIAEARGPISEVKTRNHRLNNVLLQATADAVVRWEGAKPTKLPFKLGPGIRITGSALAPNGDVWIVTSKATIQVFHDGAVTETALPKPAKPNPTEQVASWPISGDGLAGVELDDPWAIGQNGALFHLENAEWKEVELPAPPFATVGRYQAQAILENAKGDLYVNAGYSEKGPDWKTAERYRAILRQKRPKEVFRCNEPIPGDYGAKAGPGLSSSPPIANDACPTPFAILLRLGTAGFQYGAAEKFPGLRKVIKETPSLGASVDIVTFKWNGQQFAGVAAPTVAAARELALVTAKKVKADFYETRPEVVCGTPPKIEKTMTVDVATGNVK